MCSSLDGSVMSEDGVGVETEETDDDFEFQLAEHIDRLGEKRWVWPISISNPFQCP